MARNRPAGIVSNSGNLRQRHGRKFPGIWPGWLYATVFPSNRLLVDAPNLRDAFAHHFDRGARRLDRRQTNGKCDSAAISDIVETERIGIGDHCAHSFVRNAELFGGHH